MFDSCKVMKSGDGELLPTAFAVCETNETVDTVYAFLCDEGILLSPMLAF